MPEDAEMHVQESGRAGRDEKFSCAVLYKGPHDLDKRYISKQMIKIEESKCRREILYQDFPDFKFSSKGCKCCDIYRTISANL